MAIKREQLTGGNIFINDAPNDSPLISFDARNEIELEREIEFMTDPEFVDRYTEELSALSLLQCEFCESVFTDTSTLFAHTKCHRYEYNTAIYFLLHSTD